jgi:hypothetical protein
MWCLFLGGFAAQKQTQKHFSDKFLLALSLKVACLQKKSLWRLSVQRASNPIRKKSYCLTSTRPKARAARRGVGAGVGKEC